MAMGTRASASKKEARRSNLGRGRKFFSLTHPNQMGPSCCCWLRKKQVYLELVAVFCNPMLQGGWIVWKRNVDCILTLDLLRKFAIMMEGAI